MQPRVLRLLPLERGGEVGDAVRGERAAPLLREQEGGGEAQRLDIVRVLREDALRRLDGLLPVARRHQHEELLDERREEPRVQHDHLVERLERLPCWPRCA